MILIRNFNKLMINFRKFPNRFTKFNISNSINNTIGRKSNEQNIYHFIAKNILTKFKVKKKKRKTFTFSLHPLINYDHTRSVVSSLQDVRNNMIRSPCSTPLMTRRMNLNERPRTINQGSLDSFGGL